MINVAIIGASGYTGVELIRILLQHPDVKISAVTSEQNAGKKISDIFPNLKNRCDLLLENADPSVIADKCDLVFTALPHKAAMEVIPTFLKLGKKIIDLSADYRLADADIYEKWYDKHLNRELLKDAVYALPEIRRDEIKNARIVANPGCYPTSIILALAPLLKTGIIDTSSIIADSASGTTGAGRSAKVDTLFCEVNESFKAYGAGGVHRHIPEIEQELSILANEKIVITFTPHLLPIDRGILSTTYSMPKSRISKDEVYQLYKDFYATEHFVRVLDKGALPSIAAVRGSNFCDISPIIDERSGRIIVISAIDNLVKGASGQAVQNMNIISGFNEATALNSVGLFP